VIIISCLSKGMGTLCFLEPRALICIKNREEIA